MSSSVSTNDGVSFAYTDSGPANADYVTIFAVHGMGYGKAVFKKVQALCPAANTRFVAISRRGYPGSTPRAEGELEALFTYSDDEKSEYLYTRGREFCAFVEAFVKKYNLPPISNDGQRGGFAFLGWSAGCLLTASAIADIHKLPAERQQFFASHLRAHIMLEPPAVVFGLPAAPQTFPSQDIGIPLNKLQAFFRPWLTSYFQHGDLSTRDYDVVEFVLPTLARTPTIWNWTSEEKAEIIDNSPDDFPAMLAINERRNTIYRKACFDSKELLPKLKNSLVVGTATISSCICGWWDIEADCKKLGNDAINFVEVPGANHFMQWDDPGVALEAFIRCL